MSVLLQIFRSMRNLQIASALATLLCISAVSAQPAHDQTHDMELRHAACIACHGSEGRMTNAGFFPSLSGKPAHYLYEQLRNFRDGRRQQVHMAYLLGNLSDAYLQEIAQYFSEQQPVYPPPIPSSLSKAELARGQSLIFEGDQTRGIPACASCHGQTLTGVLPGVPGLLGLPRDYISAQLGAWIIDQRQAMAPDCMAEVSRKLTGTDIQAITHWLGSQPLPADARPAASLPAALPIPCSAMEVQP